MDAWVDWATQTTAGQVCLGAVILLLVALFMTRKVRVHTGEKAGRLHKCSAPGTQCFSCLFVRLYR